MRILQIAHSHPRFHPGGTELVALALHREALAQGRDSWYLGALDATQVQPHPGTRNIALSADHRESALFVSHFHTFRLEQRDWGGFHPELARYLRLVRPDIVHFHHLLNFGLESLYTVRHALPEARIVLTIHDYYLICASRGQLYKRASKQRCDGPAARDCLKCFPDASATDFTRRREDIRNTLGLCDAVFSPSNFLRDKMQRHLGIERQIEVVENGYVGLAEAAEAIPGKPKGDLVFGYFGNIVDVKGLADLLAAARRIKAEGKGGFRLHVHGAQLIDDEDLKQRMNEAAAALGADLQFFGGYHADDTAALMAAVDCVVFPSLWWENAPLVVYEALHHRRQVLAYPHSAAVEILDRYGVGLVADDSRPEALARMMERVLTNPALTRCVPNRPIPDRGALLSGYSTHYERLL